MTRHLVLLVDDCPDTREMYADYLVSAFDIEVSDTGAGAVTRAAERRPDAIVLDWNLPDMTGADALARLKRDFRTESIPVVVVSGFEQPSPPLAWHAYLTKPCRPDVLATCLNRVISVTSWQPPRDERAPSGLPDRQ